MKAKRLSYKTKLPKIRVKITLEELGRLQHHLRIKGLESVADMLSTTLEVGSLLSVGADSKTRKGEKLGYATAIQYLAPASLVPGFNSCTSATTGCKKACLAAAGQLGMKFGTKAQIVRTYLLIKDPFAYSLRLLEEISDFVAWCERKKFSPCFRPNGTSDLPFESRRYDHILADIMQEFPQLKVYDYTKHFGRCVNNYASKQGVAGYTLVFSWSGQNKRQCLEVLKAGGSVAVPFDVKKGEPLPTEFMGYEVIDGDLSDLRFLDKKNVVVGLRFKLPKNYRRGGTVKAQNTDGFVVQIAA